MYEPAGGAPRENFEYDLQRVSITDARTVALPTSVHREGFELWDAPSQVTNFRDDGAVGAIYYEECIALACLVTGASQGYVFDHVVRKREEGRPALTFGRAGDGKRPAALGRVHNDYTEESGARRLGLVIPDPETAAKVMRFSIVNIWRSLGGPVQDTPLALCDARTVSSRDLVPTEIRYQERTGEISMFAHSPRHQWSYYSHMDRHEALVFKQYDSQSSGVARFTPHSAFDLPEVPASAPLRESIEVRCLVVYS